MSYQTPKRLQKDFRKTERLIEPPNLIETHLRSYERFLQKDVPPEKRQDYGLQAVFKSVFPIADSSGLASLEFLSYSFDDVKYDIDECMAKGLTYEVPLKINVALEIYEQDKESGVKTIRGIRSQEINFGTLPLMTDQGTFVIDGSERVIVSQLHRSPGVFFSHDHGKNHSSGKILYSAKIIPKRGFLLDLEFDHRDIIYARINHCRKFPVTILLKALGYSSQDILDHFYDKDILRFNAGQVTLEPSSNHIIGHKAYNDITDPRDGATILLRGKTINKDIVKKLEEAGITEFAVNVSDFFGRYSARDLCVQETGEIVLGLNKEFTETVYHNAIAKGVTEIPLLSIDALNHGFSIRDTLIRDNLETKEDAIMDLYRKNRPSTSPTFEVAQNFLNDLFFKPDRYDLSPTGRLKLNQKLGVCSKKEDSAATTLSRDDILAAVKELARLKDTGGQVDDINHFGNLIVRAAGELLDIQYRSGLIRMARAIKERMSLQDVDAIMPHDLINSKPVSVAVKKLFRMSQLSKLLVQNNPLSEITHKRLLSALGPGGLTRFRAGFKVSDVHPTYFGRICPIETPNWSNIGYIFSLTSYARVNEYGFIETPYRLVNDGVASMEVKYLTAMEETNIPVALANARLDAEGRFLDEMVPCHLNGELIHIPFGEVKLIDVSLNQLMSVAASLVPFLDHTDNKRVLMSSIAQRLAAPLLRPVSPLIATGVEPVVSRDSGVNVLAKDDGVVEYVDASRVIIRCTSKEAADDGEWFNIYKLNKFQRSNHSACFNQRPIVRAEALVKKGQVIADGPATELGELALGRNVMVAFMSWGGYNFEDSILVSERLVKEDIFTSIHIEVYDTEARDTKLGPEEITKDIPNLGEESLSNLDSSGIVRVGTEVKTGNILVGRTTPKGETQPTPEEKLLRAIFGDKAQDVKNTSLRVPPGVEGTVIDAQVFYRKGTERDSRSQQIERDEIARLEKNQKDEIQILTKNAQTRLRELLEGKTLNSVVNDKRREGIVYKKKEIVTQEMIERLTPIAWQGVEVLEDKSGDIQKEVTELVSVYQEQVETIRLIFERKVAKVQKGDELPPGVIKMVKVYVAMKRKLSVGDLLANRHGDKGVISKILPEEDMPYLPDGSPVDVVLNPLNIPDHLNAGQIFEAHLGLASKGLGQEIGRLIDEDNHEKLRCYLKDILGERDLKRFCADISVKDLYELASQSRNGFHMVSSAFDGATETEIKYLLNLANLPEDGQLELRDGRTGEKFENKVTVGVMYLFKLNRMVDDIIHARSIGPYSLVTQQPLDGRDQFGGQMLGENEVWAMEAYGAAIILQECLTVKSDDVSGRQRMFDKIVKGDNILEPGLPESFNVLVKELQCLALDMKLIEDNTDKDNHTK
ncbi:MAG: DNA-directed RNA polymerase subunit beta [Deltaproteobacteria bacterium]|jgi:DNA-directed RNA polymerase subunit beta|nr:DNA-directed RNA polymerase subunit beta [Deltaproteobacteria bacterium]